MKPLNKPTLKLKFKEKEGWMMIGDILNISK
jgi:hypothetical protein